MRREPSNAAIGTEPRRSARQHRPRSTVAFGGAGQPTRRPVGSEAEMASTEPRRAVPTEIGWPVGRGSQSAAATRELEVLRLIARGHRNAEIAEELVITIRTARFHVSSILKTLGASNRTAGGRPRTRSAVVRGRSRLGCRTGPSTGFRPGELPNSGRDIILGNLYGRPLLERVLLKARWRSGASLSVGAGWNYNKSSPGTPDHAIGGREAG